MYGDEETLPDQLYSALDAEESLEYARKVLDLCARLLAECTR